MAFFDNDTLLTSPDDRVDGKQKVTGSAKYAAEYVIENVVYGVMVGTTIAKGIITSIDIKEAKKAPGVIDIITHENVVPVENLKDEKKAKEFELGLRIFHTNEIFSSGQPIAIVIADHLEQAQAAAALLKINYTITAHDTDFAAQVAQLKIAAFKEDTTFLPVFDSSSFKATLATLPPCLATFLLDFDALRANLS